MKVTCKRCGASYERHCVSSFTPRTNFCSIACRRGHLSENPSPLKRMGTKLTHNDRVVLQTIREINGISTGELVSHLDIDWSSIQRITQKLWHLGLVGELYGTWTTIRDEATEGEFKDENNLIFDHVSRRKFWV